MVSGNNGKNFVIKETTKSLKWDSKLRPTGINQIQVSLFHSNSNTFCELNKKHFI